MITFGSMRPSRTSSISSSMWPWMLATPVTRLMFFSHMSPIGTEAWSSTYMPGSEIVPPWRTRVNV